MGGCRGRTHATTALCTGLVAAAMSAACGARTDLTSFGEAGGTGSSGTPSSGSLASAGSTAPSGTLVSAGTTAPSGTLVSSGTATAGTLAASGVVATAGVASGSAVSPCPQTCQALGADCGVVDDNLCATKVDCGACANGAVCGVNAPNVCGPTPIPIDAGGPTVLADNQQSPTYIAVDAENVYWTSSGGEAAVFRAPLAGGPTVAFEKGVSSFGITTEAGFVFAILENDSNGSSLAMLTRAAGGSNDFQTLWSELAQGALAGPVANSTALYWSDAAAGTIWRMGLDGSDPAIIASGEVEPGPLAIDPKNLYWLSQQGIRMMPLTGGTVTTLGMPPPSPPVEGLAIAVDPFAVYSPFTVLCTVWRTPLGGGASGPLGVPTGQICAPIPSAGRGVAADGTNVYWTAPVLQDPQSGEILRIAPTGGASTTVAAGQSFPWAVTLDSHFVYWTNHGGLNGGVGQVMRAPK
jgi:hypothetical protein